MSLSDVTMTESNATRHVNCLRDCLTELQTSRNHLGQLSGNPRLPLPSSWGPPSHASSTASFRKLFRRFITLQSW